MFSSEATDTRSHHHGLLRRLGGVQDNEILTSAVAVALTMLLVAEGITIIDIARLVGAHIAAKSPKRTSGVCAIRPRERLARVHV
jgi:hypothetical protein